MVLAYLVDFDGTLADTGTANYLAYAGALAEVGVVVSRPDFDERAFGRNWRQFLPELLASQGCSAEPRLVAERKTVLYRETSRQVRFNEALVTLLTNRGVRVKAALVTSASRANVQAALAARQDIQRLFDAVVTGDDVERHKPDPQCFERAAALLQVLPQQCLVFEDSRAGIEAGVAFGAPVLKVWL
jgi:HAD superfamily hydrolase (TIGR01509 family)